MLIARVEDLLHCCFLFWKSFVFTGKAKSQIIVRQDSTTTYVSQQTPLESLNKSLIASKADSSVSSNLKSFSFNDLKLATRNFRSDNLLGEGGFGCVFKGWIDEHTLAPTKPGTGIMVAIKRLKLESFQGHKEWLVCAVAFYISWFLINAAFLVSAQT